ncbi:14303_t:CDS:2 [Funneliformis caledonium]|uniref:14303_t:CDS:1 n=1 Tax=Funneliformis caledonium TaxID=1117310 RepID=A0A9N9HQK9_9GLOM|nr:14303_t:CDS:2 [Funneliformis caledonium]
MRKIRIALVLLDWIRSKDPLTNLGHASILSTLQKYNSHRVIFLNNHRYSVKNCLDVDGFSENVVKNLVVDEPDLILKKFRKRMKQVDHVSIGFAGKGSGKGKIMIDYLRKPLILLGGPQISYAPINTLENYYPDADLFIREYAKKAFSQVVETLLTPNTLEEVRLQATVDMTSLLSPFLPIEPLENNSNSQSNLVNSPVISLNNRSFIRWETQRECPFKSITASSVNDIAVLDPTFNSSPNYLSTLDNLIKYKYKGKLSLQTRFEIIKPQFIEKCSVLVNEINTNIQLEFGVQSIIKQESLIIQRMNNLKSTIESFKESIKFVKELGAERVVAWPLMLLRGTELEKRKDELGLREEVLSSVNLDSELPKE